VDVLQQIGGVGKIVMFLFYFWMILHNDLLLHMLLLNNSILLNQYTV